VFGRRYYHYRQKTGIFTIDGEKTRKFLNGVMSKISEEMQKAPGKSATESFLTE
jgi:hypothetical protein